MAVLSLALVLTAGLTGGASAAKKKGKKGPAVFKQQLTPNLAIPDAPAAGTSTPVTSTITIPKSFKGKTVGDLDLTGLQTTGSAANAAFDVSILLTAPSGLTVTISNAEQNGLGGQSVGPLTFNDDTATSLCDLMTPPCEDPLNTLNRPFAGTGNHFQVGSSDTGPLSAFDGTSMRGTWTLTVYDTSNTLTSVLNSWGLRVTPATPVPKSKKGGVFTGSASPNAAVLDDPAAGASTPVVSTITVGKKFKNSVIGDVNVTGITTTGNASDAPDDLEFKLTAPNGTTIRLIQTGDLADNFLSVGPLTLDDDTATGVCSATPPCPNPLQSSVAPHAGTINLLELGGGGSGPLSSFNGGPMRGTWTMTVWDEIDAPAGQTSTFNSWGLKITAAKPVTAAAKPKKAGASAKKKQKQKSSFSQAKTVTLAIADDAAAGASTEVTSTITVGKAFKGRTVGDVNLTGLRTTGVGADAADDLIITLVGPTGRAVQLTDGSLIGQSIGGLTLDDDTRTSTCDDITPPCEDPVHTLNSPFAGTANLRELSTEGTGPLNAFDGTRMKGAWTLHVVDVATAGETSTLNAWGLKITPAKPVH